MRILVPLLVPFFTPFLIPLLVPTAGTGVIGAMTRPPTIAARPPAASRLPAAPHPAGKPAVTASPAPPGLARAHPPAGTFIWPVAPRPAVHRRFEQPQTQWSRGHRGVDLLAATGRPVLSAGEGVVAFSGMLAGRGVITVRHSGGLRTTYEPVDERLASGTRVQRGARLGVLSAAAGHCLPLTCLHWGAILGAAYLDPLSLLGLGRPILLPLG